VPEIDEKSISYFDEIKLDNKFDWYEDLAFVRSLYSDDAFELSRLVYATFCKDPIEVIRDTFKDAVITFLESRSEISKVNIQ